MRRIKTSTGIFLGLAAVAVVFCVVSGFVAIAQHKKYDALARALVDRLDVTPIHTLDITLASGLTSEAVEYFRDNLRDTRVQGWGDSEIQRLSIPASALDDVSIEGNTLHIENYNAFTKGWNWMIFNSRSLKTIVIHQPGQPDEVIEVTVEESESGEWVEPELEVEVTPED